MAKKRANEDPVRGGLTLKTSRSLFRKHVRLDRILRNLEKQATQGEIDPHELKTQISAARNYIPSRYDYISKRHLSLLVPEFCPARAIGLAQTVFDIPELLESFLTHLELLELLSVQRVNRQFKGAVDSSIKLQRKLSFVPHSSKDFYAPLCDTRLPCFDFSATVYPLAASKREQRESNGLLKRKMDLTASFKGPLPKIGTQCRRMLVVQPPITSMNVANNCCYDPDEFEDPARSGWTINNPLGITVGDLVDAAEETFQLHHRCQFAPLHILDDEAEVDVQALFDITIELSSEDPIVRKFDADAAVKHSKARERARKRRIVRAYAAARYDAHEEGRAIPQFEEWCQAHTRADGEVEGAVSDSE